MNEMRAKRYCEDTSVTPRLTPARRWLPSDLVRDRSSRPIHRSRTSGRPSGLARLVRHAKPAGATEGPKNSFPSIAPWNRIASAYAYSDPVTYH